MDSKEDAQSRMSLFLQILFSTIKTTEISLCTTSKGKLVLVDQKNGFQKVYEAEEIEKMYEDYIKEKQN